MCAREDPSALTPTDASEAVLVCKKTGQTMSWDEAHCPNEGKTCGYRGECLILSIIADAKDEVE